MAAELERRLQAEVLGRAMGGRERSSYGVDPGHVVQVREGPGPAQTHGRLREVVRRSRVAPAQGALGLGRPVAQDLGIGDHREAVAVVGSRHDRPAVRGPDPAHLVLDGRLEVVGRLALPDRLGQLGQSHALRGGEGEPLQEAALGGRQRRPGIRRPLEPTVPQHDQRDRRAHRPETTGGPPTPAAVPASPVPAR